VNLLITVTEQTLADRRLSWGREGKKKERKKKKKDSTEMNVLEKTS